MNRELTSHKVNDLNEALNIEVRDEPGQGNACHRYDVTGFDTGVNPSATDPDGYKSSFSRTIIMFQNGPIQEADVNGISNEVLLAIVMDRLEGFQSGEFACENNANALHLVAGALTVLHMRTKERMNRGVEGTHQK